MLLRSVFLGAILSTFLFAAGCQNSGGKMGDSMSASPSYDVVTAYSGQGAPTVFLRPKDGSKSVVMMSTAGKECDECHKAADTYFNTGSLITKCPACGATLTAMKRMP